MHLGGSKINGTTVAFPGAMDSGMPPSSPLPTGGMGSVDPNASDCGSSMGPSDANGEKTQGTVGAVQLPSGILAGLHFPGA